MGKEGWRRKRETRKEELGNEGWEKVDGVGKERWGRKRGMGNEGWEKKRGVGKEKRDWEKRDRKGKALPVLDSHQNSLFSLVPQFPRHPSRNDPLGQIRWGFSGNIPSSSVGILDRNH